jgi:SAM-dependent methyltransferase
MERSGQVGLDYARLYQRRFAGVQQSDRVDVWSVVAPWLHRCLGHPQRVLDPAAGRGEFITAVAAHERWAIDQVDHGHLQDAGVTFVPGDARDVDLPSDHFDAVFVSNFLEHLDSPHDIARFLVRMRSALRPGGRIAVMGPNFRYCANQYFDCADHVTALTHVSVDEHLHAAGFVVERVVPRFLPYSFRGRLPASPLLVRTYLRAPLAWRLLGKQFLVIGRRPLPTGATGHDQVGRPAPLAR